MNTKSKYLTFVLVVCVFFGLTAFWINNARAGINETVTYLPVIKGFECGGISEKKAATHPFDADTQQLDKLFDNLCLPPAFKWTNWGPTYGTLYGGYKVSFIWCTGRIFEEWKAMVPSNLGIEVIFLNEPDRPDQCNKTTQESVQLYIEATEHCTNCVFIGPAYSNACRSNCLIEFYNACLHEGCDLSRLKYYSLHIYPDTTNLSAKQKVDLFYQEISAAGLPFKPVWVTEIGVFECNRVLTPNRSIFEDWFSSLDSDSRVKYYFGYTTWHRKDPAKICNFAGFYEYGTQTLTLAGKVFQMTGRGDEGFLVDPYPVP